MATLCGMALAVCALLVMMLMEGASPLTLLLLPSLVLVFGATFGTAIAGSTASDARQVGSWFRLAFAAERSPQTTALIDLLVELATQARKEGMLPLENRLRSIDDPFLHRGLQMAIDGIPVEQLRTVLENELDTYRTQERVAARFFERMGGYAPTIGIIGTVAGLMHVMQNLDEPDTLGPLVAAAFVATLWGVLSANFLWFPVAAKITRNTELRAAHMEVLLAGVTAIQAGTNPRLLRQRLRAMLPPSEARLIPA